MPLTWLPASACMPNLPICPRSSTSPAADEWRTLGCFPIPNACCMLYPTGFPFASCLVPCQFTLLAYFNQSTRFQQLYSVTYDLHLHPKPYAFKKSNHIPVQLFSFCVTLL